VRRRSSWILVSSLTALTAVVAIATLAAAPPNLTKALEAQRHLAAERPQDAAVLNDLGNLLMLVPNPTEAEAAYRKAIELDPNKASPCSTSASCCNSGGSCATPTTSTSAR